MIALTHFGNGKRIALNVDLIEKVEETPDTVITLTNGTHYLVEESLDEIIDRSVEMRARILHEAQNMWSSPTPGGLRLLKSDELSDADGEGG